MDRFETGSEREGIVHPNCWTHCSVTNPRRSEAETACPRLQISTWKRVCKSHLILSCILRASVYWLFMVHNPVHPDNRIFTNTAKTQLKINKLQNKPDKLTTIPSTRSREDQKRRIRTLKQKKKKKKKLSSNQPSQLSQTNCTATLSPRHYLPSFIKETAITCPFSSVLAKLHHCTWSPSTARPPAVAPIIVIVAVTQIPSSSPPSASTSRRISSANL